MDSLKWERLHYQETSNKKVCFWWLREGWFLRKFQESRIFIGIANVQRLWPAKGFHSHFPGNHKAKTQTQMLYTDSLRHWISFLYASNVVLPRKEWCISFLIWFQIGNYLIVYDFREENLSMSKKAVISNKEVIMTLARHGVPWEEIMPSC